MEDLPSLRLDQNLHGTFVCRASQPDLVYRIESNDFSNFSESFQISQQKPNNSTDDVEEQLRLIQAKTTEGKVYLTCYEFDANRCLVFKTAQPVP